MNICLIRPPQLLDLGSFSINPSPPLGLAFIAGSLKKAGHHITIIDAVGENSTQYNPIEFTLNSTISLPSGTQLSTRGLSSFEILQRIPLNTQIVGISCMFTNNWLVDKYLIDYLGENLPNVTIIAGGESITALPEYWILQTKELDVVVMGEGEETVVALAEAIEKQTSMSSIEGIAYREGTCVKKTPRRKRVRDVEQIALPDWDQFPLANYQKHMIKWGFTEKESLPIMATRGCPYECTFCSSPNMWGRRYSMRSPQHVADEMQSLIEKYGIGNFDFYDLTAIIKREWIIEFSKEIMKRGLNVTWQIPAGTRSEAIDAEVAHHLYLSGCRDITYAPESGSARMLTLIKKKVLISDMLTSMRYSYREKMHVFINIIIALPEENFQDIFKTLWFLIRCSWVGVHEIGVARFWPYPGTELFNKLLDEKKVDISNDDFFINMLMLTAHKEIYHYNEKTPLWFYKIYLQLILIVFYTSNFIFRPIRLFKAIRNFIFMNPKSRTERAISSIIKMNLHKSFSYWKKSKPMLKLDIE